MNGLSTNGYGAQVGMTKTFDNTSLQAGVGYESVQDSSDKKQIGEQKSTKTTLVEETPTKVIYHRDEITTTTYQHIKGNDRTRANLGMAHNFDASNQVQAGLAYDSLSKETNGYIGFDTYHQNWNAHARASEIGSDNLEGRLGVNFFPSQRHGIGLEVRKSE